ncbi:hypothetical protein TIFTF001_048473 [Ficus carica]|uniref:Uncharacterized protein n=1 Tax=Ficus carica TaxID=3494 RepID=A0AA87ZJM1_FICCA|nr:hypothetical protein TIFTF001_048473 [Ficus carica]
MAVREGVWFAKACEFSNWLVETHTVNVFRSFHKSTDNALDANVISDIIDSCVGFRNDSVFAMPLVKEMI